MKTRTSNVIAIVLLLFGTMFTGCDNDDDKKDNSLLFKNTVWTGEFNYTGTPIQPISIEFKEGGQLIWHELSGEYPGSWTIVDKKLNVSFPNGNGFKAEISNENKLINIENLPVNNWTLVKSELNEGVEESLDLTTWTAPNLKLKFKTGNKVDVELGPTGATKYNDATYIHKGKSIRFDVAGGNYKWFIIHLSKTSGSGVNKFSPDPTIYPFQVSKD